MQSLHRTEIVNGLYLLWIQFNCNYSVHSPHCKLFLFVTLAGNYCITSRGFHWVKYLHDLDIFNIILKRNEHAAELFSIVCSFFLCCFLFVWCLTLFQTNSRFYVSIVQVI